MLEVFRQVHASGLLVSGTALVTSAQGIQLCILDFCKLMQRQKVFLWAFGICHGRMKIVGE